MGLLIALGISMEFFGFFIACVSKGFLMEFDLLFVFAELMNLPELLHVFVFGGF
ncbi:MAG: hypothetical protein ABIA76_04875 [Candidatus Diapherotrites archaeon]